MNSPIPVPDRVGKLDLAKISISHVSKFNPDYIQLYWQTLAMHDLLKVRMCNADNPTWTDAKEMIMRYGKHMYLLYDTGSQQVIAEIMLENFTGKAAQIHFSIHPDVSFRDAMKLGKFVLDQVLYRWKDAKNTNIPFLDSLYGLTPVDNRTACLYVLKIGMKKIGVLPSGMKNQGNIVDAMITVATRN